MKLNFKKIIIPLLILICFFPSLAAAEGQEPDIESQAAILLEPVSGKILYAKNHLQRMYPASTTKILTALLAVESGDLDTIVSVGAELKLVSPGSSLAHLSIGDTISLEDLIYGLMLPSGNDAAYVIATHLARLKSGNPGLPPAEAIKFFSKMMNTRARELGAMDSNFSCPDGFHADNHYTTAYDLGLIAAEAMKQPLIRTVATATSYHPTSWEGPKTQDWKNYNLLIHNGSDFYYPAATGLKTGYTGMAGFCLVSSSSSEDMDLIAVCLNGTEDGRWADNIALLDYGYTEFTWLQLVQPREEVCTVNICNSNWDQPDSLVLVADAGFSDLFAREDIGAIKKEVIIDETLLDIIIPKDVLPVSGISEYTLQASLATGQVVGKVKYTLQSKELFTADLVATAPVDPLPWWRTSTAQVSFGLGLILFALLPLFLKKTPQ
jgi:D-alanyl-D-alanine carboxypeptidase (penicillin-binding protein 5/6)